ncbi:S8 family peptidase [Colwellia psychrerythraea]|uniref:Serine protease, subtilase family n=1 Tax=Colwellia psychrerythraea (strain 34H / ATCC BAA-681) TaxID=167879 RepID=Q47YW0_COLP3|nr:S8 family peptidase [Colwellia psychrerythraea]AAZ23976.1 serine protease, subtilase family [Colwellia psychrerythraea 34H]
MKNILPLMWVIILMFVISQGVSAKGKKEIPKSEYGSYIVIMDLNPAIAYEGDIKGFKATKPGKNKKINPKSANVRKYTSMLSKTHDAALAKANVKSKDKVHDYGIALNGFSAKMTHEQAVALSSQDGVAKVMPDVLRQKMTDNSPSFLDLGGPAGPWLKGYDGEGIVIGVIDTGIWPEHPSFTDDGSYSTPPILLDDSRPNCEFGNTGHRPDDVAFSCNNKLIGARQMLDTYRLIVGATSDEFDSARDEDGHGTHTSSTSGGNANVPANMLGNDYGLISGIAPRAHIVMYKGLGDLGGFGSDLAAAIDQAVADGVDVINYSIGSSSFAIGPDDVAFLFAENAGVFVATSNGNSGPAPATTGSPASTPWVTSVGASTQNRTYQGSASSVGEWEFFGASITAGTAELALIDSAEAGSELCIPGVLDPVAVAGKIVLCLRGAIARVDKSKAVNIAGGAGMILYNANDGESQVTDSHWVPSVHINNTDGLVIKGYISNDASTAVAQIMGGTYTEIDAPSMAGFSSRGPNLLSGDIIKPDVTAPGVNIIAGQTPASEGRGELFQMISGTSMSSPHVAGLFAMIKQAHPNWSPSTAKSALMTTAYQDVMKEDEATPADAFDMGAGHVNPGGKANKGSIFEPGLAYQAGLFEYAAYSCGAELGIFSPGTCGFLESLGIPTDPANLNLPSIGIANVIGSKTVYRSVTGVAKDSGWRTYSVDVDAPAGYEVSVLPASIKLKSGMSATYAVTITNTASPAGEWAHGSITWRDSNDHYSVYSPIAVKGALFEAPANITGSSETGSASIDVTFGYTGDYTASGYGLTAATVDIDSVVQDPDQIFDPGDTFSNAHAIVVSGAAYLRIAIPGVADPNADLDIFLLDSVGNIVGVSANGGTDELIEMELPGDDTYTLWVHGWSAPGGSTDYELYSWVVPMASGSLTVASAPSSATLGATETIGVDWTGATNGKWHFGVIGHSDAGGLIGATLVEVDNR